jgi:hypothetical protein
VRVFVIASEKEESPGKTAIEFVSNGKETSNNR